MADLPRRQVLTATAVAGIGGALGIGLWLHDRPAGALTGDRERAAHLLRRAGFAPSAAEVDAAVREGLTATTARLLHPENVDDSALESSLNALPLDLNQVQDLRQWWLRRMAASRRPLLEKMTLFWHGLLTTSYRKTGRQFALVRQQNAFLRAHALGRFRDLLVGITTDGAMLKWLDGTGSSATHPNENYARELMELFTLGAGNYTETDVREAARALTGWVVDASGQVRFIATRHDNGNRTFLGRTGRMGVEEVVDAILAHPAAGPHLAHRLWEFFAHPNPSASDLAPVVDAFHRTGGDVREMMSAILNSPRFYSPTAYRALVRSPTELVAGFARQHSLPIDVNASDSGGPMGQVLFDPPNVAGWPGGADWLSTGAWLARLRYALRQSSQHQATLAAQLPGASAAGAVVDHFAAVMVDGDLPAPARSAIVEHVATAHSPAAMAAEAAFLVAATPEYQLT